MPLNNAPAASGSSSRPSTSINTEIGGDSQKLIMLHDFDRWAGLPVVKEVEGYKIVKAG